MGIDSGDNGLSANTGSSRVDGLLNRIGSSIGALDERANLEQLGEVIHDFSLHLWKRGIGNMSTYSDGKLDITNCIGSAQGLGEVFARLGYTPTYCYMYIKKGESYEPADHIIPIIEIDGRRYTVDPHLKNTTLFVLPEIGDSPVEVVFDAEETEGSGSGSHATKYTRISDTQILVERRNSPDAKVFQTRILDLTPRDDGGKLGDFIVAGRHVIKYEQYIAGKNGDMFNFMFRSDPGEANKYVSKIIIGGSVYNEDHFDAAREDLEERMGEEGGVLLNNLFESRDNFIISRMQTPSPTADQIVQFSLHNSN